jgi:hypothetical protein
LMAGFAAPGLVGQRVFPTAIVAMPCHERKSTPITPKLDLIYCPGRSSSTKWRCTQ